MVMHLYREQLPGTAPGTWRFVHWCGIEEDNVALSPHGGMSSDNAPPKCPECAKAMEKDNDATG